MDEKRLARLTEQQRTCLRFVYASLTSKEIAPRLGIEPGSVDQHIKAAMRILDVGDRRSAARLLAEHEGRDVQQLVYQPPEIVGLDAADIVEGSTEGVRYQQEAPAGTMREEQAPLLFPPMSRAAVPLPIGGAKPHHLNGAKRLGWIVATAVGIALAFGALISAIESLVRLKTG